MPLGDLPQGFVYRPGTTPSVAGSTVKISTCFCLLLAMGLGSSDPLYADWIVDGPEVVENDSVVVDGSLVVASGGSLTLRNVILRMTPSDGGESRIVAEPGASLAVYDSDIAPLDTSHVFQFLVRESRLIFKNNVLRGAGSKQMAEWEDMGLSLYKADSSVVEGNTIHQTGGSGITMDWCRHVRVVGNTITAERRATFGIALRFSEYCNISGNALSNQGESIFLQQCAYANTVADNTVEDAYYCIVLRHGVGYNTVAGNRLSGSMRGIWLQQAPFPNLIEDNEISGMTHEGIYVEYATGSIVSHNTVSEFRDSFSKMGGLYLYRSSGSYVLGNHVQQSPAGGITLFSSSGARIEGNHVIDSEYGIGLFYDSDGNRVSGNELTHNTRNLVVDQAEGNVITGNNLLGGHPNAYDNSSSYWSGNHWSDSPSWDGNSSRGVPPYAIGQNGIDAEPSGIPRDIQLSDTPKLEIPMEFPFFDAPSMPPIAEPTVWKNETVKFSWNWKLLIVEGGSLTMENVTLLGASPWISEPQIVVRPGAGLYVYSSRIIGGDLNHPLAVQVDNGGECIIKDSLLRNLGGEGGICINGSGSVIENSRFEKCWATVDVWGTGNRVVNNVLYKCHSPISGDRESNYIAGNDEGETIVHFDKNEPFMHPNVLTELGTDTASVSLECGDGEVLGLAFKEGLVSGRHVSLIWFAGSVPKLHTNMPSPSSLVGTFHLDSDIESGFSAEVTYSYSDSVLMLNGIDEESGLSLAYYDAAQSLWVEVPTSIDADRNTLKSEINSSALWAVMIPETSLPEDFNDDGVVSFADFVLFAIAFGSGQPHARYDLNHNGSVDFPDFVQFALAFGKNVTNTSGGR